MSIYTQPYSWKEVRIEITAAQTWAGWASSPESRGKRPGAASALGGRRVLGSGHTGWGASAFRERLGSWSLLCHIALAFAT